jgi:hypothetical protein
VPTDESPTPHFAGCRSSLELEMRLNLPVVDELMRPRFPRLHSLLHGRDYGREHIRLRFISVNSRLSVSGGWLCRRSAQCVSPLTDGKRFDFENVALSPHDECVLVL